MCHFWIGHIWRRNCVLNTLVEERLKGKRILGRRRKELPDDGKEKKEKVLKFESGKKRGRLALVCTCRENTT